MISRHADPPLKSENRSRSYLQECLKIYKEVVPSHDNRCSDMPNRQ
jgi:hypothetical protein